MYSTSDPDFLSSSGETSDYQALLIGVLFQTLDDYIKLAHPSARTKKYLQEHYLTAVDSIFDPEYRFAFIKNDENQDISMAEVIGEILGSEQAPIQDLQKYAVERARDYWEQKTVPNVLDTIPDTVFIAGHTFNIEHAHIKRFTIDPDTKTITLDKKPTQENQRNFLEAVLSAIVLVLDMNLKASVVRELTKALYTVLKVNDCFGPTRVPAQDTLFQDQRT